MKTRSSTDFKLRPNTSTSANFLLKYTVVVVSELKKDADFAWRDFAQFLIPARPRWSPRQARSWSICCGRSSTKIPTRRREKDLDLTDSTSGFQWLFLTWSNLYHCIIANGWWMMSMFLKVLLSRSPAPTHTCFVQGPLRWSCKVVGESDELACYCTRYHRTTHLHQVLLNHMAGKRDFSVQWLWGCVQFQSLWPTLSIWHRSC